MIVTDVLRRAVQIHGDRTATLYQGRRRTWSEVGHRIAQRAGGLVRKGLSPGGRVAVVAFNSDDYLETYFAVAWAGGVLVPINTRWTDAEIAACLTDCEPDVVIFDTDFADRVGRLQSQQENPWASAQIGQDPGPSTATTETSVEAALAEPARRTAGDLFGIFYTGGTTGRAKGVMLSERNIVANAVNTLLEFGYDDASVYLHSAPMFHLADGASTLAVTMCGGAHVVARAFEPADVLEQIERQRVTHALFVPTMLGALLDDESFTSRDLGSLRRIIYGASPMPEPLLRRAMASLPTAGFVQGYGQTELSPLATVLEPSCHRLDTPHLLRSAGRPTFGVEVKVFDASGVEAPVGEVGELVVRGANVMMGYWRRREETDAVFRGGWLHTGDGGYRDEAGFFYIVDRLKDMIVTGGENVYSAEVESALYQHPAVAQCAVVGVPHPKWGEAVHAVVHLRPGEEVETGGLIAHCHSLIADYKCPKSVTVSTEPLPISGQGKILKAQLRERFWRGEPRNVS